MDQDGAVQRDKHVAEITHLTSRAGRWPAGLRWIVRRTRPSRRQAGNLTAFERAAGWRYSIICTDIPAAGGVPGVPGSHHAQFTGVPHRQHAVVEDGVRTAKSMGLRNLPSKGLGGELRLGAGRQPRRRPRRLVPPARPAGQEDLKDAEPDTLRYRLLSLPARLVRHARARVLKISRTRPWTEAFLACWRRLLALPAPAWPATPSLRPERRLPGTVGAGAVPSTSGPPPPAGDT